MLTLTEGTRRPLYVYELTRMLCVFPCNAYSLGLNRGGTTPGKVVFDVVNPIFDSDL